MCHAVNLWKKMSVLKWLTLFNLFLVYLVLKLDIYFLNIKCEAYFKIHTAVHPKQFIHTVAFDTYLQKKEKTVL